MNMPGHKATLLFTAVCATAAILAATLAYAANGSVAYTYDALGRVTTASYDTGVCIIYSYDPNGNRLSETINVTATGTTGVWGCFTWNPPGTSGGKLWGP
jgi:YD repeat-containing protein